MKFPGGGGAFEAVLRQMFMGVIYVAYTMQLVIVTPFIMSTACYHRHVGDNIAFIIFRLYSDHPRNHEMRTFSFNTTILKTWEIALPSLPFSPLRLHW